MGNKGAFINLVGGDLKPKYTSYEAVVSVYYIVILGILLFYELPPVP